MRNAKIITQFVKRYVVHTVHTVYFLQYYKYLYYVQSQYLRDLSGYIKCATIFICIWKQHKIVVKKSQLPYTVK